VEFWVQHVSLLVIGLQQYLETQANLYQLQFLNIQHCKVAGPLLLGIILEVLFTKKSDIDFWY
jgi:hypothetical protein